MAVSEERFRDVLGRLAAGVTVVTSLTDDGSPRGLTATAVCSVSLDPPLVLASLDRETNTHGAILESGIFALNLLGGDAEDLAVRFSRRAEDKFGEISFATAKTGAPIVDECVAFCDCVVTREVEAGDHTIFVGRVEEAAVRRESEAGPLVYHRGEYGSLGRTGGSD